MGEAAGGPRRPPRRALAAVVWLVFVDPVGFGITIPILPFYVRSFGVSDVAVGLLAASYSLAQLFFAPLLGRLSDERGRRPVLMLSFAVSAVAWVAFGLAGAVGEAGSLGRTVGPPVMVALYVVAIPWPFLVGALLAVPALAVLAGLVRNERVPAG